MLVCLVIQGKTRLNSHLYILKHSLSMKILPINNFTNKLSIGVHLKGIIERLGFKKKGWMRAMAFLSKLFTELNNARSMQPNNWESLEA